MARELRPFCKVGPNAIKPPQSTAPRTVPAYGNSSLPPYSAAMKPSTMTTAIASRAKYANRREISLFRGRAGRPRRSEPRRVRNSTMYTMRSAKTDHDIQGRTFSPKKSGAASCAKRAMANTTPTQRDSCVDSRTA